MTDVKIFKEISIGGLTKEQLLQRLTEANVQFNKYAPILFEHPSFTPPAQSEIIQLVKVAPADFGLTNPYSYQELINRASKAGLKLCPLYLAAFLRLEYLDQAEGPHLTIASSRPEGDENYPNGLYIRKHENILWLRGYQADDYCEWPEGNEFIFMK